MRGRWSLFLTVPNGIHERHSVLTLDTDFTVYRKHGRIPLTLISPGKSWRG
jgi:hypothetical protein